MRKCFLRLGGNCLLFLILCNAFCQSVIAQISVNLELPPPYKFQIEDLWKITLTNSSNPQNVYLYGTVESIDEGKLLAEATSSVFNLPTGTKRITAAEISPIDITIYDDEIETILERVGTFPNGEYRVCVYVKDASGNQTIAVDCKQQVVETFSPVTLINPDDGESVQSKQISFSWFPNASDLGIQPVYGFRIVELFKNQSPDVAINSNPAFFEYGAITGTNFVYPPSANNFQTGKTYCWQVSAFINDVLVSTSDVWTFSYQTKSSTTTFDCSSISYTPLTFDMNIRNKEGLSPANKLLPESFGLVKVFFSCVDGSLYADGLDDNLLPYKIRGGINDPTAMTVSGRKQLSFTIEGNFNLPEDFSSVKINFAGTLGEDGITGTFSGTALSVTVSAVDTLKFAGNFAAHFIEELRFNYIIYPYISIFKTGTIPHEYSKKLDDYFDTCLKGAIDSKKKEDVLKKCDISVNKVMCFGDVARTSPPYLTFPDVDIYLSGEVCTINVSELLDEYIHAAGFLAELGTSEETDHLFHDYIIEVMSLCLLYNSGSTNKTVIDGTKSRIDTLVGNRDLADNLEQFKKATGISLSHK